MGLSRLSNRRLVFNLDAENSGDGIRLIQFTYHGNGSTRQIDMNSPGVTNEDEGSDIGGAFYDFSHSQGL